MSLLTLLPFLSIGEKIIDRVMPDDTEIKTKAKESLTKMVEDGELQTIVAQLDINKVQANSPHWFISGARPFVMWVCGVGLAVQFLFLPVTQWLLVLFGSSTVLAPLDTTVLMTLLTGMLGFGGMRTIEKLNNVAAR